MTSRDLCYWLQGFFELSKAGGGKVGSDLAVDKLDMIEKHLALVFRHEIDPSMGDSKHQQELNDIHATGIVDKSNWTARC